MKKIQISRGGKKPLNTRKAVALFTALHGKVYDYSKVKYTVYNADVTIICSLHGEFSQTVGNHLSGSGCNKCGYIKSALVQKMVTATKFHDYIRNKPYTVLTPFYRNKTHVKCKCDVCDNIWKVTPEKLRAGKSCPTCNGGGFKVNKKAIVYLYVLNDNLLGFGITGNFRRRDAQHRVTFKKLNVKYKLIGMFRFKHGADALNTERLIIDSYDIINSGINGFKRECLSIAHLEDVTKLIVSNGGDPLI